MTSAELLDQLSANGVRFEVVEHSPVYTCEEARRLVPTLAGLATKNLFLRDKAGKRHFLVVVPESLQVDLKQLSTQLCCSKLSFASAQRLSQYLGIEPGSVSLLAIFNDTAGAVELILDTRVVTAPHICCHPLVNTQTLSLVTDDLLRLLAEKQRAFQCLELTQRKDLCPN